MTTIQKRNRNKTLRDITIAFCAAIVNVLTGIPFTEKTDYILLLKQITLQAILVFAFRYLRANNIESDDVTPDKKKID